MSSRAQKIWHRFLYLIFLAHACASICSVALGFMWVVLKGHGLLFCAGAMGLAVTRYFYNFGCARYDFRAIDDGFGLHDESSADYAD